jgi:hypothetical protein
VPVTTAGETVAMFIGRSSGNADLTAAPVAWTCASAVSTFEVYVVVG